MLLVAHPHPVDPPLKGGRISKFEAVTSGLFKENTIFTPLITISFGSMETVTGTASPPATNSVEEGFTLILHSPVPPQAPLRVS